MKSVFYIIKQTYPEILNKFRIAEIIMTSDGPITRICNESYSDHPSAFSALKEKEENDRNNQT